LGGIFVEKVRRAAHGSLLHTPRLLLVPNFWREKGGQEEAHAWVVETVKDYRKLAEFLERNLQSSSRFGFGEALGANAIGSIRTGYRIISMSMKLQLVS
jgi:hypothetical protein